MFLIIKSAGKVDWKKILFIKRTGKLERYISLLFFFVFKYLKPTFQ